MYVAVTNGSTGAYSIDGISWTSMTLPSDKTWWSVTYGNGKFVAVSTVSAIYSTDGINWTEVTVEFFNMEAKIDITYGNGKFVVVQNHNGYTSYSLDGISWSSGDIGPYFWSSVAYGNGKYVAITLSSSNIGAYSTDGITWTSTTLPASKNWYSVTYGNGKFVAVADGSSTGAYSTDGITWTSCTLPSYQRWDSVTYGNGKFVAVANSSTTGAYSTDGINWTSMTLPSSQNWKVTYGNGKFVAVASSSSTGAYSTDGINWTSMTMPSSQSWYSVTYGEVPLLEVTPTPSDSTVTLTAEGYTQSGNTIIVPANTVVDYSISKTGYTTNSGSYQVIGENTLDIELFKPSVQATRQSIGDTVESAYTQIDTPSAGSDYTFSNPNELANPITATTASTITANSKIYNRASSKDNYTKNTTFTFTIKTDAYTTGNTKFYLPITNATYINPITVDWGDGNQEVLSSGTYPYHDYTEAGTYDISIYASTGKMPYLYFGGANSSTYNYSSYQLVKIKSGLLECYNGTSRATNFSYCLGYCSNLITVPSSLFKYNPKVTNFTGCFRNCNSLATVPADLFKYNTLATTFMYCFGYGGLQVIPADLFKYNTLATDFYSCFGYSKITSIPADLFKYNTSATTFTYCFESCSDLTSIPADLFRYSTAITNFEGCFKYCSSLTSIPEGLFKYNTKAIHFEGCFDYCDKLQLNANIFCDESTEITTRFASVTPSFGSCFYRTSFTGTQGTAPQLWNYTYSGTPMSSVCFGGSGNSTTSLTNYNDIPEAWGGPLRTLTITPTPSDATVIIIAEGYSQIGNTITVPAGTSVAYTVSKEGYTTQTSTVTVSSTQTISVELEEGGGYPSGTVIIEYGNEDVSNYTTTITLNYTQDYQIIMVGGGGSAEGSPGGSAGLITGTSTIEAGTYNVTVGHSLSMEVGSGTDTTFNGNIAGGGKSVAGGTCTVVTSGLTGSNGTATSYEPRYSYYGGGNDSETLGDIYGGYIKIVAA